MLVFTHSLSQSPTLCAILIPSAWCHLLPGKTKRDPAPATGAPAHPNPGKETPWSLASLQQILFFISRKKLHFYTTSYPHLAQQGILCLPFVARAENRSDGPRSQPATSGAPCRCWTSLRWEGLTCKERWVWQRRERLSYAKGDEKRPK